jgi:pteridine reductase
MSGSETPMDLTGKRALVTGAGQRLGHAIALALGRAGMRVVVHYRESREGAEATARAIREAGGEAVLLSADLTSRDAARRLADESLAALGGLDLFVASAANFERIEYDEVDDAAFDRSIGLNLASPFALAHRLTPALRSSRGSIVFVTCTSATAPYRSYLPYVVSKGALRQLMRTLSLELAPEVRVNAVAPGTVLPPPSMPASEVERLASRIPLARIGHPEDVADAVLFLARSDFVTGHEIVVDGGRTVAARDSG